MMMKNLLVVLLSTTVAAAFVPVTRNVGRNNWALDVEAPAAAGGQQQLLSLEDIAQKLKLAVYDVDTGVYGVDSKDPLYGIENIHTKVHIDPSIGLELTELAHSESVEDHRGLVLVSNVDGNAQHETPIHVGDTVIGVFAGADFRESTTGLDYDGTIDVLNRAKEYCTEHELATIDLELNRVVKKAAVKLVIEDETGQVSDMDALAGDNLRLFLMHHHANLYDPNVHRLDQPSLTGDCGGEGICATCMVNVVEGMDHLNKVGPQESSLLTNRPDTWRAACKTVIGSDNEEGSTIRIRLQPYNVKH